MNDVELLKINKTLKKNHLSLNVLNLHDNLFNSHFIHELLNYVVTFFPINFVTSFQNLSKRLVACPTKITFNSMPKKMLLSIEFCRPLLFNREALLGAGSFHFAINNVASRFIKGFFKYLSLQPILLNKL